MTTNEVESEKEPGTGAPEPAGDEPKAPAVEPETSAAPEGAPSAPTPPAGTSAEASASAATETPSADSKDRGGKPQALTPGQRLAAARAAKAAKKTAQRGREADEREKRAIDTAEVVREKTVSYLDTNRRVVVGAIGAVLLLSLVVFGVRRWHEGQERAAGTLLDEANTIQLAAIRSESEGESADEADEPTYATRADRAEAALRKYRAVTSRYPRSDAAAWALVGEGSALLDGGKPDRARAAYQKAIEAVEGEGAVARHALEGIGFAYESEEKWDEALSTYEELGKLADGSFEGWGEYHSARMLLKKGDEDQAKTRLRAVLERLRSDETATKSAYLQRQVEARLALLDPSVVGPGGPSAGEQLSPERIRELIQQAQAREGQSGDAP